MWTEAEFTFGGRNVPLLPFHSSFPLIRPFLSTLTVMLICTNWMKPLPSLSAATARHD